MSLEINDRCRNRKRTGCAEKLHFIIEIGRIEEDGLPLFKVITADLHIAVFLPELPDGKMFLPKQIFPEQLFISYIIAFMKQCLNTDGILCACIVAADFLHRFRITELIARLINRAA